MASLSQDLYTLILRAAKARLVDAYPNNGVTINFDVNQLILKGTFSIPLAEDINIQEGEYILKAQDFLVE